MSTPRTPFTFSQIQDLVQSAEQSGTRLECVFACPQSGKAASATVDIVKANDSFATKAKAQIRQSTIKSVTRSLSKAVRSLLGTKTAGRLVGELVSDQSKAISSKGGFSEQELSRATVAAFEQVQQQFVWREEEAQFVHASAGRELRPDRA